MTPLGPVQARLAVDRLANNGAVELDPAGLQGSLDVAGREWVFRGAGPDHVVIDAFTGALVRADVPARRSAAQVRLVLLLLIALFVGFGAANILSLGSILVMKVAGMAGLARNPWAAVVVGSGASLWFAWLFARRLRLLTAGAFAEPVERVTTLRWRWPEPDGPAPLFRIAPLFIALTMVAWLFSHFAMRALGHPPSVSIFLVALALAAWLAFELKALAGRRRAAEPQPAPGGGPAAALVAAALLGMRYVISTYLVLQTVQLIGLDQLLYQATSRRLPTMAELSDVALRTAAIVAVVRSRSTAQRLPLAVGLGVGLVAELLLSSWAAILLSAIAVAGSLITVQRVGVREALQGSVRYELGAALGRIVGRLTGGLLLGTAGIGVGEVLGEQVIATLALQPGESDRAEAAAPEAELSLEAERRRSRLPELVGLVVIAVALLAIGWRSHRVSTTTPGSWELATGKRWGARFPVAPLLGSRELSPRRGGRITLEEATATVDGVRYWVWAGEADGDHLTLMLMSYPQALGLIHEQGIGTGVELFVGVTAKEDLRCFTRTAGRTFVSACTAVAAGTALSDEETGFFASADLRGPGAAVVPVTTAAALQEARARSLPGYFRIARELAAFKNGTAPR